MGDTIQFCRYIPMIAGKGGRVILECPSALASLLGCLPGVHRIVEAGRPLPPFDLHAPIFSLPKIFRTTRSTIPGQTPYLRNENERTRYWQSRIGETAGPKVGLVWAGNPRHGNDRIRSIPWPVLRSADWPRHIAFFSLQIGQTPSDATLGNGVPLVDLATGINDFADFAAAITAMDLVISVDTAAAHLAGALGQAVWTLLAFASDWRWGREGNKTPWYPKMQLFRQVGQADWNEVLGRVSKALAIMTARQFFHGAASPTDAF